MKATRKLISILIVIILMSGIIPVALATEYEVNSEATLNSAISGASSGDTIKLTDSFTCSSIVVIDKSLTLDLNGKTLSSNAVEAIYVESGNLIVKGGTIDATGRYGINGDGASVTITVQSGTITCKSSNDPVYAIRCYKADIQGGTITGESTNGIGYGIYNYGGGVTVSGGTINGIGTSAGYAINSEQGKVKVSGGTITGKGDSGYGITVKQSEATISGGTITGTGAAADNSIALYGVDTSCVNVSDGYINGKILRWSSDSKLSGGYYSVEPNSDYIVSGYQMTPCSEGNYKFKIVNSKPEPTPETGDETPVMIFAVLALLSILGIVITGKKVLKNQ